MTITINTQTHTVFRALTEALRDHGFDAPLAPRASEADAARACEDLLQVLAQDWAPDMLEQCGLPEEIWGELKLNYGGPEWLCHSSQEIHDAVLDAATCDDTDYVTYCALQDAEWITRSLITAAACFLDAVDPDEPQSDEDRAASLAESAMHVGRALSTRTASRASKAVAWMREAA